jgi:hypothetical protein
VATVLRDTKQTAAVAEAGGSRKRYQRYSEPIGFIWTSKNDYIGLEARKREAGSGNFITSGHMLKAAKSSPANEMATFDELWASGAASASVGTGVGPS